MANSTETLQSILDVISTIGELQANPPVGGYTNKLTLAIANDVMSELLSNAFNWKFNRKKVTAFPTISNQQDYATINETNIGWLEQAAIVDINNNSIPKPLRWLECVRDLERTSFQRGFPMQVCWLPNDQLEQGTWPGAAKVYVNPVGAVVTPTNYATNILDANGNILILTTFGTTGVAAPLAALNAAAGVTVVDGSCVWTVANPKGQGFRISPMPPSAATCWEIYIAAQMKPSKFTLMAQVIDPVPDDYARYFREGYIAHSYKYSSAPMVRAKHEAMRAAWMQSMMAARGQGDRERDAAGFVPERSIMDSSSIPAPIGPAWPFSY